MSSEASTAPFVFHLNCTPPVWPWAPGGVSCLLAPIHGILSTSCRCRPWAIMCKRRAVDLTLPGCGRQTPRAPSPELSTLQVRQGLAPCSSHMLAGDAERLVWESHLSHAGLLQTVTHESTVRAFLERRVIEEAASRREEAKAGPRKSTNAIWRQQG